MPGFPAVWPWVAVLSGAMTDIVDENYGKLAGLLEGRPDWRPEVEDDQRTWCFGVDGAARLVITPEMDGFLMYRADQDKSWVIPRIESVAAWLDQNEAEHAGPTAVQLEFREALERIRQQRGGDQAGS
jgi:hypothetical protein